MSEIARPQPHKSDKKGMTLLEIMTSVFILVMLAAIAIPNYQKAVRKNDWVDAVLVVDTIYKAVMLYHLQYKVWPPDEDGTIFDFYNTSCSGINQYLKSIHSTLEVGPRGCDKFDYDLYIGDQSSCAVPTDPGCSIEAYRKGIGRWTGVWNPGIRRFFGNGSLEISTNSSAYP